MSLLDVEAASGKEFKASVLGAYERGERAISVPRLQRLAGLYTVPVAQLLPASEENLDADDRSLGMPFGARTAMTIDLERVRNLEGAEAELVNRYLRGIQVQRQDFKGKVLTVRSDDLRAPCMHARCRQRRRSWPTRIAGPRLPRLSSCDAFAFLLRCEGGVGG